MSDESALNSTISIREVIANQPAFCGNCHADDSEQGVVLQTCARCKLAKYCSRKCQRDDFALHKKSCKRISNIRQENQDAETLISLADTLVHVTYRSSHSLAASKVGLASAIQYYMDAMERDCRTRISLVPRVAFLLAAIEQDEAAVSIICYDAIRPDDDQASGDNDSILPEDIPLINPSDDILTLIAPTDHDLNTTNLVTLLFIKMKLLANTTNATAKNEALAQVNRIKECINNDSLLKNIQTCIPLTTAEAPSLFDATAPFEFWCLLQDLFFMTPGVQNVLQQVVPPDDEEG